MCQLVETVERLEGSYRASWVVEQLVTQVTGSIESLVKELLVVRQLVRARRTELVEHRLPAVGQTACLRPFDRARRGILVEPLLVGGSELDRGLSCDRSPCRVGP